MLSSGNLAVPITHLHLSCCLFLAELYLLLLLPYHLYVVCFPLPGLSSSFSSPSFPSLLLFFFPGLPACMCIHLVFLLSHKHICSSASVCEHGFSCIPHALTGSVFIAIFFQIFCQFFCDFLFQPTGCLKGIFKKFQIQDYFPL